MHYSTILNNSRLLDKLGGIDGFTSELNGLVARGLAEVSHEYSEDDGDDIKIEITNLGKSFLAFKERETK